MCRGSWMSRSIALILPLFQTNLTSYSMSDVEVQHRFSDFFSLYKYLVESYPGVIVPHCPPKDALGEPWISFVTTLKKTRNAGSHKLTLFF